MAYDGPSFNHRNKQDMKEKMEGQSDKPAFNPHHKQDWSASRGNHSQKSDLDFSQVNKGHHDFLPDKLKTRSDYQNEAEKILTSKPRDSKFNQLYKSKQSRKYRPRFKVTEVPSPMFGYTEEQKERMGYGKQETKEEIEWYYPALKQLMLSRDYDFILTEECLNASILKEWQE